MSKEYTEKERREAIIDCAGSFHPTVGGKFLPWNPWLHIRKTYTDEIDRLESENAAFANCLVEAMLWVYASQVENQKRADMIDRYEKLAAPKS